MALVCSVTTSQINSFTFIDCSTINISYDIRGLATVSFTVVSTSQTINLSSYSEVTFGSNSASRQSGVFTAGRIQFKGNILNYELTPIAGTSVFEHRLQLVGWACRL